MQAHICSVVAPQLLPPTDDEEEDSCCTRTLTHTCLPAALLLHTQTFVFTEGTGPYEVPADVGVGANDAFYKVTVLEEELRVMAPDLGAIQVRMIMQRVLRFFQVDV